MIITGEDLELLERNGFLRVENRGDYGPCSLNLTIDKLLKPSQQPTDHDTEAFLASLHPVDSSIVSYGDFHYFRTRERFTLPDDVLLDIASRSGFARLGLRSIMSDEELQIGCRYVGNPLIQLASYGPRVHVAVGDSPAQAVFHTPEPDMTPNALRQCVEQGDLHLTRGGKTLTPADLTFHGGVVLTLDERILVYRGNILTPGKLQPDDFEEIILTPEGKYLPKSTFFLSSSAEHVSIDERYAGYVTHGNSFRTNTTYFNDGGAEFIPPPFLSHPNAPYIWPRNIFSGKITFENVVHTDCMIYPGMKISEITLERLSTKSAWQEPSKYNGQTAVQASKL